MAMIKARIKELEKFTGTSEPEPIVFTVRGFPVDSFNLTIGTDSEILERTPNETEQDFTDRCESYARAQAPRSKGRIAAPVPILMQVTPECSVSPTTGEPITVTIGEKR